ncbi:MAG: glycine--tRNA ligase subunit beta, partial [Nitrospiraceae bacterium]
AIGFAGSQGVTVGGLEIRRTPKGEYLFAVRREAGGSAVAVLGDILSGLIGGLSFPKAMRWNETGMRFARPIRWLLALYGGKVVGIQIGGIRAGNRTFGHRFLGSAGSVDSPALPVKDLGTYMKALERHGVIPDQDRRRAMILSQLTSLTRAARGHLHRDEDLLEQAIYSVEYPHAILGEFEPHYLSLPKEVLMTAMKEHQGYFSLMGLDGALLPKFIAVANMKLPDMRLVREGNERVLAARLADAKFFFEEDRKIKLIDRVKKLAEVTFHQKLGTLYQKQERVIKLTERLASILLHLEENTRNHVTSTCKRAAQLCKADLLTGMVGEFPTLQGVIGGEYAGHDGESEEVSRAIAEQYLPRSMDGELPQTHPGKILSLADRLDTIAAFFHVGLVPTGSEDPFALRRHATAIVRIFIEGNLRLALGKAVDHARTIVADDGFQPAPLQGDESRDRIVQFIFERLRYYGRTVHGLRDDVMEAVLKSAAAGLRPFDELRIPSGVEGQAQAAPSLSRGGAFDLVDL